jgi:hypothetical protein
MAENDREFDEHYGPAMRRHQMMMYVTVKHEIIYHCNFFYTLLACYLADLLVVVLLVCCLDGLLLVT